jgi:hypothetical protein
MSNYDNDSVITNDLRVITGTKYSSMRKLTDLHALLVTGETLAIKLAAQPAQLTLRQLSLMQRTLDMHLTKIRKRITQVERMNESKVNKQRDERNKAHYFDTLSQSGVIPQLLQQTREYRSERAREEKEAKQQERAAFVTPMKKILDEAGYNPLATSEERADWARKRELQLPTNTNLDQQGNDFIQRMYDVENERERDTERRKIVAEKTGATALDTDIDKVGSADEWSKLI